MLCHNSKDSGSPKHEAGFLLPSMEDCIRQNERQLYILNSKLSSSDYIEHIHTKMLRGYEHFSEGPVILINTASDKASAGSHISCWSHISIQEGESQPTCILVAQPDWCSFDGAALPCWWLWGCRSEAVGQKWWRAVLGHLGATKARRRCEWHTTSTGTCFLIYPSSLPSEGGGARNSTAHVTAKENEVQSVSEVSLRCGDRVSWLQPGLSHPLPGLKLQERTQQVCVRRSQVREQAGSVKGM